MPAPKLARWPGSPSATRTILTRSIRRPLPRCNEAQPQIGELKDYAAFFIGNSYVLSNNPEESIAYLRDFGTRFPDSLYDHDATIAYAKALLATSQPTDAIKMLEAHRVPASAETEYFLGKAYVQNGAGRTGAEILRRVYYNYATNYTADQAATDLRKIPEAATLPPATYSDHLKRADALYKARRYPAAAEEYQYVVDLAPAGQQSAGTDSAGELVHEGWQHALRPRGAGSHSRRRQRSQRGEVVSAGRDRSRCQGRGRSGHHPCSTCARPPRSRLGWSRLC